MVWGQVRAEGGGGGRVKQTECCPQLRTLWLWGPLISRHQSAGHQSRQQHPQSTHLVLGNLGKYIEVMLVG